MACVRYRFKSAKEFQSLPIAGNFISVADLKHLIAGSARFGKGKDFDLRFTNAQTGEEYLNEVELIPKQSSVLVHRIPGPLRERIVIPPDEKPRGFDAETEVHNQHRNQTAGSSTAEGDGDVVDLFDFGNDLSSEPPRRSNSLKDLATAEVADDEDSKIRALVSTPALDYSEYTVAPRFGRNLGSVRRGQARKNLIFENKTPPEGYVCHRCGAPGHFIHHCPTNGDPSYDKKRPLRAAAVPQPDEAAFEREMAGLLPSADQRATADLAPELLCPLCNSLMKDAVLTSKCCFSSFCDKCIRDHVIAKLRCACGANNMKADDLIPNKTLRETIRRLSESTSSASSAEYPGGASEQQALDAESACRAPKARPTSTVSTITQSSASLAISGGYETKAAEVEVGNCQESTAQSMQKGTGCIEDEISGPSNPTVLVPLRSMPLQGEAHGNAHSNQQLSGELHSKKNIAHGGDLMTVSHTGSRNTHYIGGMWTDQGSFSLYPGMVPYAYMPDAYGFAPPGSCSPAMAPYWMQVGVFGNHMQANVFNKQMQANAMQDFSSRQSLGGCRIKDNNALNKRSAAYQQSRGNKCAATNTDYYYEDEAPSKRRRQDSR